MASLTHPFVCSLPVCNLHKGPFYYRGSVVGFDIRDPTGGFESRDLANFWMDRREHSKLSVKGSRIFHIKFFKYELDTWARAQIDTRIPIVVDFPKNNGFSLKTGNREVFRALDFDNKIYLSVLDNSIEFQES